MMKFCPLVDTGILTAAHAMAIAKLASRDVGLADDGAFFGLQAQPAVLT